MIESAELNLPMEDKTRLFLLYIICLRSCTPQIIEELLRFANLLPKYTRIIENIKLAGVKMGTGLIIRPEEKKVRDKQAKVLAQKAKKNNSVNVRFQPFLDVALTGLINNTLPEGLYPHLEKQSRVVEKDSDVYRAFKKEVITIHNMYNCYIKIVKIVEKKELILKQKVIELLFL